MTASLTPAAAYPDPLSGEQPPSKQATSPAAQRPLRKPVQVHEEAPARKPLPRLRQDLTISQQVTSEGTIFVIKDPLLDRFYRFPQEAHFIASQLDGQTELEVVRKRTEE